MSCLLLASNNNRVHKAKQNARKDGKLHAEQLKLDSLEKVFHAKLLAGLTEVWLFENEIKSIHLLKHCKRAELIYVNSNQIETIVWEVENTWENLEELNVSDNVKLETFQGHAWKKLKQLYINNLPRLRKETINETNSSVWVNLKVFHANNTPLNSLPKNVAMWTQLTNVSLNNCNLESLPEEIGAWVNVVKLFLNHNKIKKIPKAVGQLKSLEKLYLNENELIQIPLELNDLPVLNEVYFNNNAGLTELPPSLKLGGENVKLYLNYCNVSNAIADEFFQNNPSLEILSVSGNKNLSVVSIRSLPLCKQMKFLHFKDCPNLKVKIDSDYFSVNVTELRVFELDPNLNLEDEASRSLFSKFKFVKQWDFTSA